MNSPPKGELGSRFWESANHASLHGGPMVRHLVQTGRFKHVLDYPHWTAWTLLNRIAASQRRLSKGEQTLARDACGI
jgi:hypothetical protein